MDTPKEETSMQTLRGQQSAIRTTSAKQDQNIYEEVDVESPI